MSNLFRFFLLSVVCLAVPRLGQTDNPTPPSAPVRLVFIHHSTGGNWLADPNSDMPYGGLGLALKNNNYYLSATNYGWGPEGIGDRTDIPNWPEWFIGPNHFTILSTLYNENGQNIGDFGAWSRSGSMPTGENEIVMFKSCFPNSDIYGEPSDPAYAEANDYEYSIANAKAVYQIILTYFKTRPDKLFILITSPPLAENEYLPGDQTPTKRAANARALNNWLIKDWLKGYPLRNVAVFDYYNVLTSNNGSADQNDADRETGNHHRFWNGGMQHQQSVNQNFSAYPSGDSHPSTAGHQKATLEFVPLLNVFYHRWQNATAVTLRDKMPSNCVTASAHPNPFNHHVVILMKSTEKVVLQAAVYNILGEKVYQFKDHPASADGTYQWRWSGVDQNFRALPSGLYFYKIIGAQTAWLGKILLSR